MGRRCGRGPEGSWRGRERDDGGAHTQGPPCQEIRKTAQGKGERPEEVPDL